MVSWTKSCFAATFAALFAASGNAAIVVERYFPAGSLPAGVVGAYLPVQPSALYNFGQTFTLGTTGQLRQVDVLLSRLFPGPAMLAPFHMTLTSGIGGKVLADKNFTVPDALTAQIAWVPVDLVSDAIVLAAGTTVFLTLSSNNSINTGITWFGITGADALLYQGGAGYQQVPCSAGSPANSGCGVWQPVDYDGGPIDFSYRAYIDDAVALAAVPEPAAWAMMIAGFGFVGAAQRRRRLAQLA